MNVNVHVFGRGTDVQGTPSDANCVTTIQPPGKIRKLGLQNLVDAYVKNALYFTLKSIICTCDARADVQSDFSTKNWKLTWSQRDCLKTTSQKTVCLFTPFLLTACIRYQRKGKERKWDLFSAYRQYNSTTKRSDVDHTG